VGVEVAVSGREGGESVNMSYSGVMRTMIYRQYWNFKGKPE